MISGWAHSGDLLSPVAAMLNNFDVVMTSPATLYGNACEQGGSTTDVGFPYAGNLIDLIACEGRIPCCLVGWSMGGIIAMQAASAIPECVDSLVLVSATSRFCTTAEYPHGVEEPILRAMTRGLRTEPEKTIEDFLQRAAMPLPLEGAARIAMRETAMRQGVPVLVNGLEYLLKTDLRETLKKIPQRTLVIHGRQDAIIPWQAGEYMSKEIANSRFVVYEGAGHNIPEARSSVLAKDVADFIFRDSRRSHGVSGNA